MDSAAERALDRGRAAARRRAGARSAARRRPRSVVIVDDRTTADDAYGLACQGTGLLWRGDFQNARQMLNALASRADRPARKPKRGNVDRPRRAARNACDGGGVPPPSAGARAACAHARHAAGPARCRLRHPPATRARSARGVSSRRTVRRTVPSVVSLRELLGVIGAHEWRTQGHRRSRRRRPHPSALRRVRADPQRVRRPRREGAAARGARARRASHSTSAPGTGVLAAVLARRGVARVIATDLRSARARLRARRTSSASASATRSTSSRPISFPRDAPRSSSAIRRGCPRGRARRWSTASTIRKAGCCAGFLAGLAAHLAPGGEGWLILSDLAEHLGLRTREELLAAIDAAGLRVVARADVRPVHPKAFDATDPLHAARAAEVTSLWRLAAR